MRKEIQAKSELRPKIHSAANDAWQEKVERAKQKGNLLSVVNEEGGKFDKIFEYSDTQLKTELIPLYEKMLELYTSKLWLAEKSTVQYHGALAEFVEIWKRFLSGALPGEVVNDLDHSERKLQPFYQDIQDNFDSLGDELKK